MHQWLAESMATYPQNHPTKARGSASTRACVCVCELVWLCGCMGIHVCVRMCIRMHVSMRTCVYVCVLGCLCHACVCVCVCAKPDV